MHDDSNDDESISRIIEKDNNDKFLDSPKFVILSSLQRMKNNISADYAQFLKIALMAKSTTKPKSLCNVIAHDTSKQYQRYEKGTTTLYKMVKKDLINVVAEIYDLIYNKTDQDESSRNETKNHLHNRLQKIYDCIKSHEWYTKKHIVEVNDIYTFGIMQSEKLFSHFLSKKIKEKFSAHLIESRTTRKLLNATFTSISRELNYAFLNVPSKNISFSISKLVDEEDQKLGSKIFEIKPIQSENRLLEKKLFTQHLSSPKLNLNSDKDSTFYESSFLEAEPPLHESSVIIHQETSNSPKSKKMLVDFDQSSSFAQIHNQNEKDENVELDDTMDTRKNKYRILKCKVQDCLYQTNAIKKLKRHATFTHSK